MNGQVDPMKGVVLVVALIACSAGAHGQSHKHEGGGLGAHVHGRGVLNIAIEKGRVSMDFEVPAVDIVGFEHQPKSAKERALVEDAKAKLADPIKLFAPSPTAGCRVTRSEVAVETEDGHGAFHGSYELACTQPRALKVFKLDYFGLFKGAQKLSVRLIGGARQVKFEAGRGNPVLEVK